MNQAITTNYLETNAEYKLDGFIVCKKKGSYYISIGELGSRGLRGKNCTNAVFNMEVLNTNK